MDEKELKTSPKQRFFIILIAVLMVGSIIASYAAIVISGNQGNSGTSSGKVDEAKIAEYEAAYHELEEEFGEFTKSDFDEFIKYKSEIKGYNEASANENGVQSTDIKEGTGKAIADGDANYLAYYVGWCADETIFDSSFNDNNNPTAFGKILDASLGMIEGWATGVEGMKMDGVRVITIPGNLAYGDTMEICGGTNKPLKFLVMTKEKTEELNNLSLKLDDAYMRLQYAYNGMDYDAAMKNSKNS